MKSNFQPQCHIARDVQDKNIAHCESLGLPGVVYTSEPLGKPLAVIGGGHSVAEHLATLRAWPGDIWACTSSFQWCRANGIDATFISIDPGKFADGLLDGIKTAILATCNDPSVFEALRNADVRVFALEASAEKANHGVTTVTATPELAVRMGYRSVSYFGVDSSFPIDGNNHINGDWDAQLPMTVRANGESFYTCAEFLMQAELMATFVRLAPALFKCESEGLFKAMVADIDYDITDIEQKLAA